MHVNNNNNNNNKKQTNKKQQQKNKINNNNNKNNNNNLHSKEYSHWDEIMEEKQRRSPSKTCNNKDFHT